MIHLLLMSREGRWAHDPEGRQYVLRPRAAGDPGCARCHGSPQPRPAVGEPVWVATKHEHPDFGGRAYLHVVCRAHADLQTPLDRKEPA